MLTSNVDDRRGGGTMGGVSSSKSSSSENNFRRICEIFNEEFDTATAGSSWSLFEAKLCIKESRSVAGGRLSRVWQPTEEREKKERFFRETIFRWWLTSSRISCLIEKWRWIRRWTTWPWLIFCFGKIIIHSNRRREIKLRMTKMIRGTLISITHFFITRNSIHTKENNSKIKHTKEMYQFERYVHLMVEDRLVHDVQSREHRLPNHFLAARKKYSVWRNEIQSTNFVENTETRQTLFEMNRRWRIEWIGN